MRVSQLEEFHAVCPITAVQPPYNMLQREIERDCIPWCQAHEVAIAVYWPLMKGLLTGKFGRDHQFDPRDGRKKYPMFQGEEWRKNLALIDELKSIARGARVTLPQLVVNWTIHQPGITAALCGAKRPDQIAETAQAMAWQLTGEQQDQIERALRKRGEPVTQWAI
jgi:aryl-alcohol dehydrogenase-like predicted oxidoreductase